MGAKTFLTHMGSNLHHTQKGDCTSTPSNDFQMDGGLSDKRSPLADLFYPVNFCKNPTLCK